MESFAKEAKATARPLDTSSMTPGTQAGQKTLIPNALGTGKESGTIVVAVGTRNIFVRKNTNPQHISGGNRHCRTG